MPLRLRPTFGAPAAPAVALSLRRPPAERAPSRSSSFRASFGYGRRPTPEPPLQRGDRVQLDRHRGVLDFAGQPRPAKVWGVGVGQLLGAVVEAVIFLRATKRHGLDGIATRAVVTTACGAIAAGAGWLACDSISSHALGACVAIVLSVARVRPDAQHRGLPRPAGGARARPARAAQRGPRNPNSPPSSAPRLQPHAERWRSVRAAATSSVNTAFTATPGRPHGPPVPGLHRQGPRLLRPLRGGRGERRARRRPPRSDARPLSRPGGPRARHRHLRAGGRPDHPRRPPAAELDVRHADRPRGRPGLISDLDDIIDLIDEVSDYLGLYKIEAPMEQSQRLAHVLLQATRQIAEAMPRLRAFDAISHYTVEINRLENDGDRISRDAIASLFESGIDPLVVIRWKDIFERLEEAIDACEHVANIARRHRHQELVSCTTSSWSSSSPPRWCSTSPTASTTPPTRSRPRSRRARCRRARPSCCPPS